MLKLCSPPGSPQPTMKSSRVCGSNPGICAKAARTICTVSSSPRMPVIDPLNARPIGDRAAATMTASGMDITQYGLAHITDRRANQVAELLNTEFIVKQVKQPHFAFSQLEHRDIGIHPLNAFGAS